MSLIPTDHAPMPDPIAADELRRMHAARIGPHVTCPASRHAAMIAEGMMTLDETPIDTEHAGASIAATVAALWEARADLSALRAREAEMRAALRPFAEYMHTDEGRLDCDYFGKPLPDDLTVGWIYLTHGDFRRARAALSQPDSGEGAS